MTTFRSRAVAVAFGVLALGVLTPGVSFGLAVPVGATVLINDFYEVPPFLDSHGPGGVPSPFGFSANTLSIQSGVDPVTGVESLSLHGEYVSSTVNAPGTVVNVNFNFTDPAEGLNHVGDTLLLTFTWTTPTGTDPSNVSLDLDFRSDGDRGVGLPALANATTIVEYYGWMNVSSLVASHGGPRDINVQVGSAVPEPSTIVSAGFAGVMGVFYAVRRRKRTAA